MGYGLIGRRGVNVSDVPRMHLSPVLYTGGCPPVCAMWGNVGYLLTRRLRVQQVKIYVLNVHMSP